MMKNVVSVIIYGLILDLLKHADYAVFPEITHSAIILSSDIVPCGKENSRVCMYLVMKLDRGETDALTCTS